MPLSVLKATKAADSICGRCRVNSVCFPLIDDFFEVGVIYTITLLCILDTLILIKFYIIKITPI